MPTALSCPQWPSVWRGRTHADREAASPVALVAAPSRRLEQSLSELPWRGGQDQGVGAEPWAGPSGRLAGRLSPPSEAWVLHLRLGPFFSVACE